MRNTVRTGCAVASRISIVSAGVTASAAEKVSLLGQKKES